MVNIVISDLTNKTGISTIEKDKEVFLICPRDEFTGVIVSSVELTSFKVLIERFMNTIEDIYSDEIKKWDEH